MTAGIKYRHIRCSSGVPLLYGGDPCPACGATSDNTCRLDRGKAEKWLAANMPDALPMPLEDGP